MKRVAIGLAIVALLSGLAWLAAPKETLSAEAPQSKARQDGAGKAGRKGREAPEGLRQLLPQLAIGTVHLPDEGMREPLRKLLAERRFAEAIEILSKDVGPTDDEALVLVWRSWMEADRDGMLDYMVQLPDPDGTVGQSGVKGIFQALAFTDDPADVEWVKAAAGRVPAENWQGMLYLQVSDYWMSRGVISAEDYFTLHDSFPHPELKADILRVSISEALDFTGRLAKSGDMSVYERQQMAEAILEQIWKFKSDPAVVDGSEDGGHFGTVIGELARAKAEGAGCLDTFAAYRPPTDPDQAAGFAAGIGKGLAASTPAEIDKLAGTAGNEAGADLWRGYLDAKVATESLSRLSGSFADGGLAAEKVQMAADASFRYQMRENPGQFARELRDLPEGIFRDRVAVDYIRSKEGAPDFDATEWKALVRDQSALEGKSGPGRSQ